MGSLLRPGGRARDSFIMDAVDPADFDSAKKKKPESKTGELGSVEVQAVIEASKKEGEANARRVDDYVAKFTELEGQIPQDELIAKVDVTAKKSEALANLSGYLAVEISVLQEIMQNTKLSPQQRAFVNRVLGWAHRKKGDCDHGRDEQEIIDYEARRGRRYGSTVDPVIEKEQAVSPATEEIGAHRQSSEASQARERSAYKINPDGTAIPIIDSVQKNLHEAGAWYQDAGRALAEKLTQVWDLIKGDRKKPG